MSLFEFALLVDAPRRRAPEWILECLSVLAANGLTKKRDLIGLRNDDYDASMWKYGLQAAQCSWLRRCVYLANTGPVTALAERGSATGALLDAIEAEEDEDTFVGETNNCKLSPPT